VIITKTVVVLQYDKDPNLFVDIDNNSGGYPYEVDIYRAYNFRTIEAAIKYAARDRMTPRTVSVTYSITT
jgi:hypothetical protein